LRSFRKGILALKQRADGLGTGIHGRNEP
jgi:hypothetical protein